MVALTFYLAAPHLTARPHALALPLLMAWSAGPDPRPRRRSGARLPLTLLPVMTLWANLRGGLVIGLALAVVVCRLRRCFSARDG